MNSTLFRNFNFQKKHLAIFLFLFTITNHVFSQNPNFSWAKQIGGTSQEYGKSVTVDVNGNIYTTGWFSGTVDFDPGLGTYNLISLGGEDIFVSKLDASGNFIWAKQMGGSSSSKGQSIKIDINGNVYTTGYFNGTTDFDPAASIYNLSTFGSTDIFVSKLNASGNFLWAKQLGSVNGDEGTSIAIDLNGNVFTTGMFQVTADFDPGPATYNLTSFFGSDIFISKLDPTGNFVWAKQMGGINDEWGFSIAVHTNGNVYTTGRFQGTADFDPGPATYNLTAAVDNIFISNLDNSGNFIWAKQFVGGSEGYGFSIAVDNNGNVHTTGMFKGSVDFDPGAPTYNVVSVGGYDIFVSKLDPSGNFQWAKQIGSTIDDAGLSIVTDVNGNVFAAGRFMGSADFDPGAGTFNLISAGQSDVFVSKFDISGNFQWAKKMGGIADDNCQSIALDYNENVYLTGYFNGTADFDPGPATYNLTSLGGVDAFIVKLGVQPPIIFNPNFRWAKNMGGINTDGGNSIAVDANGNVYTTGYFQGTADFDPGTGTYNLISAGNKDIFISKLDPLGNFLWAKQIGGGNTDEGRSIFIDATGNVYIVGIFFGTVDLDPGAGVYNLDYGNGNIFINKLNTSGDFLWAKQLGNSISSVSSMFLDGNGNIYTTGYFSNTADFDPGSGTFNLITTNYSDIFVSKLDPSGNFVWAKQMGGTAAADAGYSITVDNNGNVYTTGSFRSPADFDPGPGTYNISSSGDFDEIFVSKLDASGNFVWAKGWGGLDTDVGFSIAVDPNGNVYTTGRFSLTVDFDPGAGIYNLNTFGNADIFVSKLDASGNFIWAKQMGGAINDMGRSIKVDVNGNILLAGFFTETADFDPGPNTFKLTSFGDYDIFISKLDNFGNFLWAVQMGGLNQDEANSITTDVTGNIYTTGFFAGTADFNPGPEIYNLTAGDYDVFVTKFEDPLAIVTPQIFLDKALIQFGQTDIIWGKYFTPNGQIKIKISSQSPNTNLAETIINANGQGYFNFTYYFVSSLSPGVYNILATDLTTLQSSYFVRLVVVSTPIITRNLKIISPITISSGNLGASIKIGWKDKPSNLNNLIPNTSRVIVAYRLEYNRDNTGWQFITTKITEAKYLLTTGFNYNYIPAQIGNYQFRVVDVYDALNTDVSAIVTMNNGVSGLLINYKWDFSGNTPDKEPIGVASDGTARIYVKVLKKAGNNKTISSVQINISDPVYPAITEMELLGKLKQATDTVTYSIEGNSANSTGATSSTSGSGNIFWFWYVAPDDFTRNPNDTLRPERDLRLLALVTYSDNTTESVSKDIKIVRPPLMLVHGWGGAESSWKEFFFLNNVNNEGIFYNTSSVWKNYNQRAVTMNPIGSFAENARLLLNLKPNGEFNSSKDLYGNYFHQTFHSFLKNMRDQQYASNRVDYVCHSMGGAMGRTAINLYPAQYKPSVGANTLFKNYGNGFINKFITLNTPHNGSPVADFIINKVNIPQLGNLVQGAYVFGDNPLKDYDTQLLLDMFHPQLGTPFLNLSNPTEAFKNLRSGSQGVKFLQTNVKNHLIAGDYDFSDCTNAVKLLQKFNKGTLFAKILAFFNLKTCEQIDNFFNQYEVPNFITKGDLIVPLGSQLPGKNLNSSGTDYTIFSGQNAFHTTVRNSNDNLPVSLKTLQLLNSPIGSNLFATTIAANPSSGPIVYRNKDQNTPQNFSQYVDTTKIVIDKPYRMSSIKVDSTISINIRLKDTVNHKYTSILFQGEIFNTNTRIMNQLSIVQVNPFYTGVHTIYATAVYDSLGSDIYFTDTLSVNILKDTGVLGFIVNPETKILLSKQKHIPEYLLIHNNYISNLSIADTGLHILIADPAVISFSNTGKYFQANDTGSTYAVISYKQFKDTLFFIIEDSDSSLVPLPVTLISFTGTPKSVYNLLEWKTTAEVNFSHFNLEKSLNGSSWTQIGRINSRSNSSTSTTNYDFKDSVISNNLTFYRLILVDIDGNYKTSNTVLIRRGNDNSSIKVFPNPVTNSEVFIDFGSSNNSSLPIITMVDLSGITLNIKTSSLQSSIIRLDLYGLKPSTYILKIQKGSDFQTIKLVVIE